MIELVPLFLFILYIVPFLVAAARGHQSPAGVLVANLLIGWTIVGWLGLLIWVSIGANNGGALPPVRRSRS
jgi:hypothetical protein